MVRGPVRFPLIAPHHVAAVSAQPATTAAGHITLPLHAARGVRGWPSRRGMPRAWSPDADMLRRASLNAFRPHVMTRSLAAETRRPLLRGQLAGRRTERERKRSRTSGRCAANVSSSHASERQAGAEGTAGVERQAQETREQGQTFEGSEQQEARARGSNANSRVAGR